MTGAFRRSCRPSRRAGPRPECALRRGNLLLGRTCDVPLGELDHDLSLGILHACCRLDRRERGGTATGRSSSAASGDVADGLSLRGPDGSATPPPNRPRTAAAIPLGARPVPRGRPSCPSAAGRLVGRVHWPCADRGSVAPRTIRCRSGAALRGGLSPPQTARVDLARRAHPPASRAAPRRGRPPRSAGRGGRGDTPSAAGGHSSAPC